MWVLGNRWGVRTDDPSRAADHNRIICAPRRLAVRTAISRAESAFGVPFRLQQDLPNEANVASHGTSL